MSPDWLPTIVTLADYGGDWQAYEDALYAIFSHDFVETHPTVDGLPVRPKWQPIFKGRAGGFWHITHEGSDEANRTPDLRRCERLVWVRPVVEHHDSECVRKWANERNGKRRLCLWVEEADFLVVLEFRKGHLLLWTAYAELREHTKRKLLAEYDASTQHK